MSDALKEAQALLLITQIETVLGRPAVTGEEPDLVGSNGTIYGNVIILRGQELPSEPAARERLLNLYAKGYADTTGLPIDQVKTRMLAHASPAEEKSSQPFESNQSQSSLLQKSFRLFL